jgi:hypothetical protein
MWFPRSDALAIVEIAPDFAANSVTVTGGRGRPASYRRRHPGA